MSDDTELKGFEPQEPPRMTPPRSSGDGLFATTAGRALLIVGGVVVLLAIVGVAVYFVLGSNLFGVPSQSTPPVATTGTAVAVASTANSVVATSTSATEAPVPDIENRDVFSPRDPFVPVAPATIGSSSSSSESGSESSALTLTDIDTSNGVREAVFTYKGTTYTVKNGDTIGSSPWKVITVGSTTVVMEYGDVEVTFSLGEGITK